MVRLFLGAGAFCLLTAGTAHAQVDMTVPGRLITGTDFGSPGQLNVYDSPENFQESFFPYTTGFTGGVRVAAGDVNNDGVPDIITGAGPGAGPQVKVFDGTNTANELRSFFAFDAGFSGGVNVAAGDVNNDGVDDIIVGAGAGGAPQVTVFSGVESEGTLASFFAYALSFNGGVTVASGDINGDGTDDIITGAGPGGGPHVRVFDGTNTGSILLDTLVFNPTFTGGVFVAGGDVNASENDEVIVGTGAGGLPTVAVLDGVTGEQLSSFFAFELSSLGGVRVGAFDEDGDGDDEIVTATGDASVGQVNRFDGIGTFLGGFFPYGSSYTSGVFVAGAAGTPPMSNVGDWSVLE